MQEELEEQKLFNTRLELLEKETVNNQNELEALNSTDCLKVGQNSYLFKSSFLYISSQPSANDEHTKI